jgi:hypothetical protein
LKEKVAAADERPKGFFALTMQQPFTVNVGTTSPVAAIAQSVYFACGMKATQLVLFVCLRQSTLLVGSG